MGRPAGAKNKRTLVREAQITAAKDGMANGDLYSVDSLEAMNEAMMFFVRKARQQKADSPEHVKAKGDYYLAVVSVAEKIAPYNHARLSHLKVAGDRDKPILSQTTVDELLAAILADIAKLGMLPELLKLVEGGSHKVTDGVANDGGKRLA